MFWLPGWAPRRWPRPVWCVWELFDPSCCLVLHFLPAPESQLRGSRKPIIIMHKSSSSDSHSRANMNYSDPQTDRTTPGYSTLTCQVLDDRRHVDRSPHADAVFVRTGAQVPHHPPHGEDDPRPGWSGQLRDLLFPTSGWHRALVTKHIRDRNT